MGTTKTFTDANTQRRTTNKQMRTAREPVAEVACEDDLWSMPAADRPHLSRIISYSKVTYMEPPHSWPP